ncbi:MAG: class I SAM-dependent methyltransferase [Ignavibacteriales bacterium]|nr:class I SAM-dependent methyltransferase [Ignavibacteriales bacterium]
MWFAKQGHKVLATDLSEGMLDIVRQKIDEQDLLPASKH